MRITYRQLVKMMNATFTEEQWDNDVTIEDACEEECYPAELRICNSNHKLLDNGHPVIFCPYDIGKKASDDSIERWICTIQDCKND